MKYGKNINILPIDSYLKCTLANWTGVVYKIPRTELENCKERDDLKQSGVYVLFGTNEEKEEKMIYVGQANERKNGEGVLSRLQEHKRNPKKDYWTEAIVFVTSNNSFGATEISYLESRFCELAIQANRYIVRNENHPTSGNITEEKASELEEFIEYAQIITDVMGYKLFTPFVSNSTKKKTTTINSIDNFLYYKNAIAKQTEEGIVLLKGSKINPKTSPKCPKAVKNHRKKYKNKVKNIHGECVLIKDILFSSPSAAVSYVNGYSENGKAKWKNSDGKT